MDRVASADRDHKVRFKLPGYRLDKFRGFQTGLSHHAGNNDRDLAGSLRQFCFIQPVQMGGDDHLAGRHRA